MYKMKRIGMSVLALAVALSVVGCNGKKTDKAASQVAARVNGDEITVPQLDTELSKLGNIAPEQTQAAANKVLRALVDQQVLVQKAVADKMDSDPQVLQDLEAARRQVLARAYVQKITANVAKPSEAEIADYFGKNPALFAERRIYRLQEISVQAGANLEVVKAELAKTKNLNDFLQWLKAQKIPAKVGQSVKASEQLPMEILPRIAQMKDGQAMTLVKGDMLDVLVIADSQSQPLTQEQAKPSIERFLTTAKKREAAAAELKQLRDKAKIEYVGPYSDAGKAESATTAVAPPTAPAVAPPASPAVPAQAAAPAVPATAPAVPAASGAK